MGKKALVCITPQTNSKRLIDKGSELIETNGGGELLILHILKGTNIFADNSTGNLLQDLFEYGKLKGGSVHALSGDNIGQTIEAFAREHNITDIVLGEAPVSPGLKAAAIQAGVDMPAVIRTKLPHVNVVEIGRG